MLDMAVVDRIVQKSGSWFGYGDTRLGQGRDKSCAFLMENPEILDEIRTKVLQKRGAVPSAVDAESNGEVE